MEKSVRVAEYSQYNWKEQSTDVVRYSEIINFERAGARGEHHCVMCGRTKGVDCEIPNQNKDVCKTCDSSYWRLTRGDIIVKFCKGCKKFSSLSDFADKPEASKCAKCRHRGRQNYYSRKQGEDAPTKKAAKVPNHVIKVDSKENHIKQMQQFGDNARVDGLYRTEISPRALSAATAAAGNYKGNITTKNSQSLLPIPPHYLTGAFGPTDSFFADSALGMGFGMESIGAVTGRHSGGSSSSRSSLGGGGQQGTRNPNDSSDDDVLMRSFAKRFGPSDDGYRHSSSGNSSLGSADFSFMTSPVLGQTGGVLARGTTPAAAALPGANLSNDTLNFTWTADMSSSPRPPSSNTHSNMIGTGGGIMQSGAKSDGGTSTPAQLPLFGASPVVAPTSTYGTGGGGYLPMIDTGLPCDITPLTSLSSPGAHSDDSSWKWDHSQNPLMNLASISQCVLSTDSGSGKNSPTDIVIGCDELGTSDLSSVSSVLFASDTLSKGGGGSGILNHSRGSNRSRRSSAGSGSSSSSSRKVPRPSDFSDKKIRGAVADTSAINTVSDSTASSFSSGIAHRGGRLTSPEGSTMHDMKPPVSQPKSILRNKGMGSATRSVSAKASSSIHRECEGEESVTVKNEVIEKCEEAVGDNDASVNGHRNIQSTAEKPTSTRPKRKRHHCDRIVDDDNIMRVAIGDAKRLRMLSPSANGAAAVDANTRSSAVAIVTSTTTASSSLSVVSESTDMEEEEEDSYCSSAEKIEVISTRRRTKDASSSINTSSSCSSGTPTATMPRKENTCASSERRVTRRSAAKSATSGAKLPPRKVSTRLRSGSNGGYPQAV